MVARRTSGVIFVQAFAGGQPSGLVGPGGQTDMDLAFQLPFILALEAIPDIISSQDSIPFHL